MSTSTHDKALSSDPPAAQNETQVEKEVRFAVVMYGGVSLAIYINGVAQELLHMVRSTAVSPRLRHAPQVPYEVLRRRPTEAVYRKVSYLLSEAARDRAQAVRQLGITGKAAAEDALAYAQDRLEGNEAVTVKLVVDIIAGTSAGGINGVFLGKALANCQEIKQLEDLWVEEGDIGKLINDRRSVLRPLAEQRPPASLLNSGRMYFKLLRAFDQMASSPDCPAPEGPQKELLSPYVEELDLFVTATDLVGVKLPLQLSDRVVYERRYRNVFHFVYADDGSEVTRNHFSAEYNPFLAYAARCTSSFPFAFEPMSLEDIEFLMGRLSPYRGDDSFRAGAERWRQFFKKYDPKDIPGRSFGDGGYLDNKPFTYATDTITRRSADVPVERKLVYVEPSPDHPEEMADALDKPDALSNTWAALLTLPRAETIREDLQRVLERNRTIERVNRILHGIERDAARADRRVGDVQPDAAVVERILERINRDLPPGERHEDLCDDDAWAKLDLKEMLLLRGHGYLAYHRLDIASVTDGLALLVVNLAGLDEDSDFFVAVRSIIRVWRDETYTDYKERRGGCEDPRPTMNEFLLNFNLRYPLRRLNFLRAKLDQLYKLDQQALDILYCHAREYERAEGPDGGLRVRRDFVPGSLRPFVADREGGAKELADDKWKEIREQLREELRRVKAEINRVFLELRRRGRELKVKLGDAQVGQAVDAWPGKKDGLLNDLLFVLGQRPGDAQGRARDSAGDPIPTSLEPAPSPAAEGEELAPEEQAVERAKELLGDDARRAWIQGIADEVSAGVRAARGVADRDCKEYLRIGQEDGAALVYSSAVRAVLRHYYLHYDHYDMLTFPILYNSGVGEANYVEVVRFSPDDATALIDEMNLTGEKYARPGGARPVPFQCSKLAGASFGHFGAFLNHQWRRNDILWGRLDGAERIIRTLLPDRRAEAARLIGEAQAAIVCEAVAGLCHLADVSQLCTHRFTGRKREEVYRLLLEGFMHPRLSRKPDKEELAAVRRALEVALRRFLGRLCRGAKGTPWQAALANAIKKEELLEYFRKHYKPGRGLLRRLGLRNSWRSVSTLTRMFGGVLRPRLRRGAPQTGTGGPRL
jgi:patatin-related protein